MTTNPKAELVARLYQRTQEGAIRWSDTIRPTAFRAVLGAEGGVEIRRYEPDVELVEGDSPYYLVLFDRNGNDVEYIRDSDLGVVFIGDAGILAETLLDRLYFEARRQGLGADELVERLLGALEEPEHAPS